MSKYFNTSHLKEAKAAAQKPNSGYFWHFRLATSRIFLFIVYYNRKFNTRNFSLGVRF